MNLAKVSADGQVTIPLEIRNHLRLEAGDMLLFTERDGEIAISNASAVAVAQADSAVSGAAASSRTANGEDVQSLLYEIRYGENK